MFTLSGNLANLGKLELAKGDWEVGRRLMTEAITLARKFETRTLGTALNNLALTSMWRGLLPESIELLTESVAVCKAEKYPTGVAHALMNLYAASSEVGESEKAIRCIEEARELIPSSGGGLLSLDGYLVDAQIRFGSVDAAYAQSVDALRRLKDVPGLHRTFGLYVMGLIAHGSLDEADAHLKSADERYAEPTSTLAHFNYLAAYAHLLYRRKDTQKAQQYLERYIAARGSLVSAYDGGTNFLWIKLDLDLIDDARDIAMQIPDHMKHTLRGQLCAARIAYEERSFDEAIRLQRAVNQLSAGRRMRGYLEKLLLHYEQTMESGRYKKIPRSELLPSLI
jgi:tetratricopeptide (TPR) repeat protein